MMGGMCSSLESLLFEGKAEFCIDVSAVATTYFTSFVS